MLDRRKFLISGLKFIASYCLVGTWKLLKPSKILAESYISGQALRNSSILSLNGTVIVDQRLATLTTHINKQSLISTNKNSNLVINLEDGSLCRVLENSKVRIVQSEDKAIISLFKGAILVINNKNFTALYTIIIHTKTADYAVYDSVAYYQTIDEDTVLKLEDGKIFAKPDLAKDYVCLCNGTMHFLTKDLTKIFQVLPANYHNSFFVLDYGKYVEAPLLNHNDKLITETAILLEEKSPQLDWIRH